MHTLIIGTTECGKSTLARIIIAGLRKQRKNVVVLDPIGDPTWVIKAGVKKEHVFTDTDQFLDYLQQNQDIYFFVDESGEVFNEGMNRDYNWLGTRSRHFGHSGFFIGQRATMITTTIRNQCSQIFLFTSGSKDSKLHAEEWNKPVLENAHLQKKLQFYHCDRFQLCNHMEITFSGPKDIGTLRKIKNERGRLDNDSNRGGGSGDGNSGGLPMENGKGNE